jgi:alpha-N-arabinofuranosidase
MRLTKKFCGAVGILVLLYNFSHSIPLRAEDSIRTFKNPILSGFHPDPSIVRVGKDFYLTNSTFEYFPGLPIYHSRDLVHWTQIGNALDRQSQLPLKGATDYGGLYAPTLRYWKGTYYLTCTNVSGGGNFIVKAKDPAGPWSEPVWMNIPDIDGSMFFDDDGKAYFTNQGGGEKAGIKQCEFDPQTGQATTPSRAIYNDSNESWNEGPHLYKIKGRYYLMLAEGGTGDRHMEVIHRSDNPWGPWEPCPYNPILTERDDPKSPIQCTGHADLIDAPDGTWWMVFLGVRPRNGKSVLGRETFLAPVSWTTNGWPVVNGDHHVALEMPAPALPLQKPVEPATRWDFGKIEKLGPEWLRVRNGDPADLSLNARPGCLRILCAPGSLSKKLEEPAFLGQRQGDFRFMASVSMEFQPAQDGEEAGLCVRANDDNHYEVGVEGADGKALVFVRNTVKGKAYALAQRSLDQGRVFLKISGDDDQYQFAWSKDGTVWETLGASPSDDLSREEAGGFTGTVIGLYASSNGKPSKAYADFGWFEMEDGKAPEPATLLPRPTPPPMAPSDVWRIRCGGSPFTDRAGNRWSQDVGWTTGDTIGAGSPIDAPPDPELYATERWGPEFSYRLPVPPGKYRVTLKFAETYVKQPGDRVFDVLLNGNKVLDHFDILKEAGAMDKGIDRSFSDIHMAQQGIIEIRFKSWVQNAKICAIEIVRQH